MSLLLLLNNSGTGPNNISRTAGEVLTVITDGASRSVDTTRSASDDAAPVRSSALFTDDFNRPDGAPGSAWTGPAVISSQQLLLDAPSSQVFEYVTSPSGMTERTVSATLMLDAGLTYLSVGVQTTSPSGIDSGFSLMFDVVNGIIRITRGGQMVWYSGANYFAGAGPHAASLTAKHYPSDGHQDLTMVFDGQTVKVSTGTGGLPLGTLDGIGTSMPGFNNNGGTIRANDFTVSAPGAAILETALPSSGHSATASDVAPVSTQVASWLATIGSGNGTKLMHDYPAVHPTKAIAGVVRDSAGAPYLLGATVILIRDSDGFWCQSTTSSLANGGYSFPRDTNDPNTYTVYAFTGDPLEDVTVRGLVPA